MVPLLFVIGLRTPSNRYECLVAPSVEPVLWIATGSLAVADAAPEGNRARTRPHFRALSLPLLRMRDALVHLCRGNRYEAGDALS